MNVSRRARYALMGILGLAIAGSGSALWLSERFSTSVECPPASQATAAKDASIDRRLPGAVVVRVDPDPQIIRDAAIRARIRSLGYPWLIRDTASQMDLALVPAGHVQRWKRPPYQQGRIPGNTPQDVTVGALYVGRTEVTQGQWERVMGAAANSHKGFDYHVVFAGSRPAVRPDPAIHKGPNYPVVDVSVRDIHAFLDRLNRSASNKVYSLPSVAESQWACLAESEDRESLAGVSESDLARIGWYGRNSGGRAHQVATKPANSFGLFDVYGNVEEFCADVLKIRFPSKVTISHAMRGGCFCSGPRAMEASTWFWVVDNPRMGAINAGFRVVRRLAPSSVPPRTLVIIGGPKRGSGR